MTPRTRLETRREKRVSSDGVVAGVHKLVAAQVAGEANPHLVHHVAEREVGLGVGPANRAAQKLPALLTAATSSRQ